MRLGAGRRKPLEVVNTKNQYGVSIQKISRPLLLIVLNNFQPPSSSFQSFNTNLIILQI
ncbi:hypothetical protein J2772_003241 [Chryseobacterium jejuense]|nr:hypothetical protein [Chryseobacterium jejuense]